LEFHRGCYTSHAQQKWWNRHCEGLLYQAELFAALANISAESVYPQAKLTEAWKKVLFNQFHDILPGTAIPVVYQDANQAWSEVEQVGSEILANSLGAIASQIALPPAPQPDALAIVVFNPLNWRRREVVYVDLQDVLEENQRWEVYDLEGNQLPSQLCETTELQFLTTDIPSVGYSVFWLCPQPLEQDYYSTTWTGKADWILENEFLRVVVDAESGGLRSLFDKVNHREVVQAGEFNQLQAFQDVGQYWDAWNIDPNYAQHPLPPATLTSIEWIEEGLVEQRLRVIRQLGKSEFCQDYILSMGSPLLKIENIVDWQENHVLVKAAFRLNLAADYATYEIPCGAIRRPTQSDDPKEQAKWEVPALRWADLSTVDYGVSLLNDCKYGYDSQPNRLRLTLLRSPNWPTPSADRGEQKFTYAIYPHAGNWESAHTVRHGYALNIPLKVMFIPASKSVSANTLSPVGTLLDLSAENLVLTAFKQSESDPQSWILRCYESHGESADLSLKSDLGITVSHPVDILERPIQIDEKPLAEKIAVLPWKISSLNIRTTHSD
jgi:alpha-mannosidase